MSYFYLVHLSQRLHFSYWYFDPILCSFRRSWSKGQLFQVRALTDLSEYFCPGTRLFQLCRDSLSSKIFRVFQYILLEYWELGILISILFPYSIFCRLNILQAQYEIFFSYAYFCFKFFPPGLRHPIYFLGVNVFHICCICNNWLFASRYSLILFPHTTSLQTFILDIYVSHHQYFHLKGP